MGNLTDAERPVPPVAPISSLAPAMRAFVKGQFDRAKMLVPEWATTFRPATVEDVREAWEREMSAHSRQQHHNCEEMDK